MGVVAPRKPDQIHEKRAESIQYDMIFPWQGRE